MDIRTAWFNRVEPSAEALETKEMSAIAATAIAVM